MKNNLYLVLLIMAMPFAFLSCNDDETYADQKEREARQINQWLSDHKVDVISFSEFLENDTVTNNPETGPDFSRNEYVLFPDNGVYMQIINRGGGRITNSGEKRKMNARYLEILVSSGDTLSMNLNESSDQFYIQRTGDNYTASFISGVFPTRYGYSVPNAWIMPFMYIKPGFLNGPDKAKIRLIVPHNQGTQQAASSVYPTFYEITITTGQWQ